MPTKANIQQTILNGSYSLMKLVNNSRTLIMSGGEAVRQGFIQWFRLNLQALTDQYNIPDYSSVTTVTIYDRINQFVGIPYNATVDPNFQSPGTIINFSGVLVGYNKNTIPFTTTSGSPAFVLSSYNTTYKFLYGNNPDPLSIYLTPGGAEFLDEQTAPIIVRVNPSDINSDILSITWPFATAQTGYVLIGGVAPAASSSPSGGGGSGGSIPFTYSENDLLQDGNGAWYLPLSLPGGYFVVYASSNGTSIGNALDENFTPARLYNFTDNSPQVIKVNIMK